ncbi:MAG: L-threonylcarbamoyladenylate synthase [Pseudomonadota bacterium]
MTDLASAPPRGAIAPLSAENVALGAALLRAGGLVAFPTETVYGLGADARSDEAVARIFAAKGRPRFNPLIVHATDLAAARKIAVIEGVAARLAEAFWPGPLTLVAPRRDARISLLVSAGLDTLALRVPAHEGARALIAAAGGAVAAPSANPSGKLSPTRAEAVADGLGEAVDLILDGGPSAVGLESTILAVEEGAVRVLREGGAPREALEAALGAPVAAPQEAPGDAAPRAAPGMLASHYAPGAALRLNAAAPAPGEAFLGFGPLPPTGSPAKTLSERRDLREAAARLFAHLRALDEALGGAGVIAAAPIPETGLGRAINDRLRRAAAPRPDA